MEKQDTDMENIQRDPGGNLDHDPDPLLVVPNGTWTSIFMVPLFLWDMNYLLDLEYRNLFDFEHIDLASLSNSVTIIKSKEEFQAR